MRNVFVEKWPPLVKVVLAARAVIFTIIRWAVTRAIRSLPSASASTMETENRA